MSRKQLFPHSFFGGSRINSIHFLKQSIYCFLLNVMLVECCTSVSVDRNIQLVTIWPGVLEHHPLISWLSKCFPHDMRCCITVFGPAQTQGTTNPMFYHGHPQLHSVVLRWFEVSMNFGQQSVQVAWIYPHCIPILVWALYVISQVKQEHSWGWIPVLHKNYGELVARSLVCM